MSLGPSPPCVPVESSTTVIGAVIGAWWRWFSPSATTFDPGGLQWLCRRGLSLDRPERWLPRRWRGWGERLCRISCPSGLGFPVPAKLLDKAVGEWRCFGDVDSPALLSTLPVRRWGSAIVAFERVGGPAWETTAAAVVFCSKV